MQAQTLLGGMIFPLQAEVTEIKDTYISVCPISERDLEKNSGMRIQSIPFSYNQRYTLFLTCKARAATWLIKMSPRSEHSETQSIDLEPETVSIQYDFAFFCNKTTVPAILLDMTFCINEEKNLTSDLNLILDVKKTRLVVCGPVFQFFTQLRERSLSNIFEKSQPVSNCLVLSDEPQPLLDHQICYPVKWMDPKEWTEEESQQWIIVFVFGQAAFQPKVNLPSLTSKIALHFTSPAGTDLFVFQKKALQSLLRRYEFGTQEGKSLTWRRCCQETWKSLDKEDIHAQECLCDVTVPMAMAMAMPMAMPNLGATVGKKLGGTTYVSLLFLTDVTQLLQFRVLFQRLLCFHITNPSFHNKSRDMWIFLNTLESRHRKFVMEECQRYSIPVSCHLLPSSSKLDMRKKSQIWLSHLLPTQFVHVLFDTQLEVSSQTWMTLEKYFL